MIGWIVAAFVAGGMFGVVVMALAAASGEGTEKSDVPRAIAGRESVQISEDFTGSHIQRVLQREWTDDVPVQKPGDGTVDGLRLFRVQDARKNGLRTVEGFSKRIQIPVTVLDMGTFGYIAVFQRGREPGLRASAAA